LPALTWPLRSHANPGSALGPRVGAAGIEDSYTTLVLVIRCAFWKDHALVTGSKTFSQTELGTVLKLVDQSQLTTAFPVGPIAIS